MFVSVTPPISQKNVIIRTKAISRLSEMANHPHWCVRTYALAVMKAEAWAREELSLPMFAELEEHELERVVAACESACTALERTRG